MKNFNLTLKYVFILGLVSFILHLIWENAQAPLFAGYASFAQHLPICSIGTIGDIIFTLLVYFGISLLKDDFGWIFRLSKKDIFVLAVIGFLFAIGIEWRALLFEKWSYTDAMPIISYLGVGLTPVLQMIILLPLSFYLTKKIYAKI